MQVNEIFFVGSNKYGQSGTGEKNNLKIIDSPRSYDFGVFIKQVSCGYHHSAILTISGLVYTMGSNIHGTLGTNHEEINYSFLPILVEGLEGVSKIESGAFHLCALTENGEVYSWGRGMDGQLGIGTNKNSCTAQKVLIEDEVTELSCGTNHTLLVTNRGEVYAFGNGIYGQLGTGNNKNQQRPARVRLDAEVTMVAAGQNHSLFLTAQGTVYGTGDNTSGQVGIGNGKKYVLEPQYVSSLQNVSIIQAAKFSACICEGQLYAWGGATKNFTPHHVDSNGCCFAELKAGNDTLMVLSSKGDMYNWQATTTEPMVTLKKFELKSKAILDFSIGQNHTIILGDIIRTVEDKCTTSQILKCHEAEPTPLKESKRTQNTSQSRLKTLPERGKSTSRLNAGPSVDSDKQNRKPTSPFGREPKKPIAEKTSAFFQDSLKSAEDRHPQPVQVIAAPKQKTERNSHLDQLLQETRSCKKELETLHALLTDANAVSVDSHKNSGFLSQKHSHRLKPDHSPASEKSNITLLREKDMMISSLQQELSKKQALIITYEGSLNALQRLLQAQSRRLEELEPAQAS